MEVYMIDVDPIAAAKPTKEGVKIWNMQRQLRFECMKNLEEQHDGRPLYHGPIHLDINFYIKVGKQKKGTYHMARPPLTQFLQFIDNALRGIIIDNACVISSCYCKKVYDTHPRIEFKISEL